MILGVLTGGGDCPGLNAVIRAVVKSAGRRGWEVIGIEEGYAGLQPPLRTRPLSERSVKGILSRGGTILGTASGISPEAVAGGGSGDPEETGFVEAVRNGLATLKIGGLIAVGGDGTMRISRRLSEQGIQVIGIPKTIDNDIPGTDFTFGFQTAVNTATDALDKLHTTAESHHRVIVVEVMGRYAGWIALEAGIAGGADVILIPEIPFAIGRVCQTIQVRYRRGDRYSIVVAAEGAKPVGGAVSVIRRTEGGAVERLGGIGGKVGDQIAERTGMDVRVTVLGHLQRGGSPTPFDRILATRFGVAAVDLAADGRFGRMVCLKGTEITTVSLAEASNRLKTVQTDGPLVQTAEALGISLGR